MTSQLQSARRKPDAYPWVASLLASKPNKLVAVSRYTLFGARQEILGCEACIEGAEILFY